MADLAQKLKQTNNGMTGRMGGYYGDRKKNDESQLSKVTKDRQVYKHLIASQFLILF